MAPKPGSPPKVLVCDEDGNPTAVSGGSGGTVTVNPGPGSLTNRSGTITTGGVAQNLVASNLTRKYLFVRNPTTASGDLWISLVGTATTDSPSIKLAVGDSFVMEAGFVATNALSVIAATTGHKVTCWEG